MQLGLTTTIAFNPIKDLINIDLLIAATIIIHGTKRSCRVDLDFRTSIVMATESHFSNRVVLLTDVTLKKLEVGPNLPVDFFP